jgi:hypothetical protein
VGSVVVRDLSDIRLKLTTGVSSKTLREGGFNYDELRKLNSRPEDNPVRLDKNKHLLNQERENGPVTPSGCAITHDHS